MASPQLENGYTKIANELLEALAKSRFDMCQWSIILWVMRQSYGWNKPKTDPIRTIDLAEAIGMLRGTTHKALSKLIAMKVICRDDAGCFSISKDHDSWGKPVSCGNPIPVGNKSVYPRKRPYTYSKEINKHDGGKLGMKQEIALIIDAYKEMKGIPKDNKEWDKENYGRFAKNAKAIMGSLSCTGSVAVQYLKDMGSYWDSKDINWHLGTIAKNAGNGQKPVAKSQANTLESDPNYAGSRVER